MQTEETRDNFHRKIYVMSEKETVSSRGEVTGHTRTHTHIPLSAFGTASLAFCGVK